MEDFTGGEVEDLVSVGGELFFAGRTANDPDGRELWKSDGTAAGTVRVHDLTPGAGSSSFVSMYGWGGKLYFGGGTVADGVELWVSDGTDAGTYMLKDLYPGVDNGYPVDFVPFNGKLYFSAQDAAHGDELWEADGTTAGTRIAHDFLPGSASSYADPKLVFGSALYAVTSPTGGLSQMWKVDASDAATLVKQVATNASAPYVSGATTAVLPLGPRVFFAAAHDTHSIEPWVSDGTTAGTYMVKDVMPGGGIAGTGLNDTTLAAANGVALFNGQDATHGQEVWQSDGTAAGTTLVADLAAGATGSDPTEFFNLVGGSILFQADPAGTFGVNELYAATVPAPAAPVANPGTGYVVSEGGTIKLDGSASTAGGGLTIARYEWDLNYDGTSFQADAGGAQPAFSAANLDGPTTRTVALRVTDSRGSTSLATTVVTVANVPPTAAFSGSTVAQGSAGTVAFANVHDVAADTTVGFRYSYDFDGDGTFDLVNSTSASATVPAADLAAAGTHTVVGRVTDKDGGSATYQATVVVKATGGNSPQLTGTVIGTSGSYANKGNTRDKAVDGNVGTYFDAPTSSGGWVGLDLGSPEVVDRVEFAPRSGYVSRMAGGRFQGANTADFSGSVVDLYTVPASPAAGVLTSVPISNGTAFRYVRYLGPANGYGNVAEVHFFGHSPGTPTRVTGTVIGTTGSWSGRGNTRDKAFDGNLSTFFDAPTASGGWVGLDVGSPAAVTQVRFAPRAGFGARMVGGAVQASSTADFSSGVVTLYTLKSTPADNGLATISVTNATAYRYYRYLGPANSYCDVAELEFDI